MDTLRDLAALVTRVADKIDNLEELGAKEFSELQHELNRLQIEMPTAATEARVKWFVYGLENFEIIMDFNQVRFFLKREYLGKFFPECYQKVMSLLDRLIEATKEGSELHTFWKEERARLERFLLEGRL